ncbi:MAG: rhomboid family intramembrane serine protease [Bacteroidota bacterium]
MNPDSPLARFRIWYTALPRAMRWLLTVNTVAYVAYIFLRFIPGVPGLMADFLAFQAVIPDAFLKPWTFVTHAFVNIDVSFWGLIGFLFSMLWLYWMGRDYEDMYGSHRLFGLYVLTALGGALVALAASAAIGWQGLYFGAMGPALGVLCCVATLHPNRGIGLLLLGVVPLKWVAIGFVALFVLIEPLPTYMGAALVGFLFARAQLAGTDLAAWAMPLFSSGNRARSAPSRGRGSAADDDGGFLGKLERWAASREEKKQGAAPASKSEAPKRRTPARRPRAERRSKDAPATSPRDIDRILDKINEQGYDALTDEEKRILYEASGRA